MRWQSVLVLGLLVGACGEDEPPPPPPTTPAASANKPKPPAGPAIAGGRLHVEDRVICPEIEKSTGPSCNPASPTCEDGTYCLPVKSGGTFCEPCQERASI